MISLNPRKCLKLKVLSKYMYVSSGTCEKLTNICKQIASKLSCFSHSVQCRRSLQFQGQALLGTTKQC